MYMYSVPSCTICTSGGAADGLFNLSATSVSVSLLVCEYREINKYPHSHMRSFLTFVWTGVMD